MKKVLLINSNTEIFPYPVAPLGISLVASALEPTFNVKLFDAAFEDTDSLLEVINTFKPDYIGMGIRNIDNVTMGNCKWYLNEIKEAIVKPVRNSSSVPFIVGGSGFSIAPQEILNFLELDYGVVGEAEGTMPKLLENLENGIEPTLVNVIKSGSEKMKLSSTEGEVLKLPNANIDIHLNFGPYKQKGNYPIQTKRGCSHKCIYCSYPNIEGMKYRLRPVSEIVDEIQEVAGRIPGVAFEFVDSTFNSPLKHALDICKEIIRRKLNVKLRTMGVNPGEVTEELLVLMKKAGFAQIDCTPDSASSVMLKKYRKNFNKKVLIKTAELLSAHNMPTMWFFMLGGPGETEQTIKETFEFIDRYICKEDMVHITEGIRIIPNTELYSIALNEGVISATDSIIEPMFYVNPYLGREKLGQLLKLEVSRRNNVMNSVDTTPPKELMKAAIDYRKRTGTDEPMFRTLLRLQNSIKTKTE